MKCWYFYEQWYNYIAWSDTWNRIKQDDWIICIPKPPCLRKISTWSCWSIWQHSLDHTAIGRSNLGLSWLVCALFLIAFLIILISFSYCIIHLYSQLGQKYPKTDFQAWPWRSIPASAVQSLCHGTKGSLCTRQCEEQRPCDLIHHSRELFTVWSSWSVVIGYSHVSDCTYTEVCQKKMILLVTNCPKQFKPPMRSYW